MIQCPYCGANLDESAKFCGKCLSLLVAQHEHRGKEWPPWLHPYTALIVIAIVSLGLVAFSVFTGPERKTTDHAKPVAENTTEKPNEDPATRPAAPDTEPEQPDAIPPVPAEVSYEEMAAYDNEIQAILDESDRISGDLDRLLAQNSDSNFNALGDLTRQLQFQSQKMRKLRAPRVVAQTHNKLSNAQSILYRGYQKLMHYQKSGDVAKLDEGRRDIETAKEKRQAALDEITAIEKTIPPPPQPQPAAEPSPPAEPPPPAEQPPANTDAQPPERERRPGAADEGHDGAGACIPKRLVEMYPPGPTRDRIINSFSAQYNSNRVCGEMPPPPPAAEEAPPPGDSQLDGSTAYPDESVTPPEYDDTSTDDLYPDDEPVPP